MLLTYALSSRPSTKSVLVTQSPGCTSIYLKIGCRRIHNICSLKGRALFLGSWKGQGLLLGSWTPYGRSCLGRKLRETAQEDVVARVFARHGLRLDVSMSHGLVDQDPSYPYIKASSWIRTLEETGNLKNLLGLGESCRTLELAGPALLDFWEKYALAHADHEVYSLARNGELCLRQCVPIYLHGDEGTTYKKDGALVLSFFCPLGRGVACQKDGDLTDRKLPMNFQGHSFKTRFVMATIFKAYAGIKSQNISH